MQRLLFVPREDDADLATDGVLHAAHGHALLELAVAFLQVAGCLLALELTPLALPGKRERLVEGLLGAVVQTA